MMLPKNARILDRTHDDSNYRIGTFKKEQALASTLFIHSIFLLKCCFVLVFHV